MSVPDLENTKLLSGDELRNQTANLLSSKYGTPDIEKRANGKKVDVQFKYPEFGKLRTLFVECKDYARPLQRNEVVNIWSDYSGIIDQSQPADLLLVTRHGLTTDAQEYVDVEQTKLRHQSIWELENEILGLTEYTRSQLKLFESDGLHEYYIPARGRKKIYDHNNILKSRVENNDELILSYIETWLANDTEVPLAVLGGYGAGKSSLARKLVSAAAASALSNPTARIPILIKLGQFSRYSSIEGMLAGMFSHEFPVNGFSIPVFMDCNEKGRFLIVCDGFDEMKHAMSWSDFKATLGEINKLIGKKSKLVLLGRPNAFLSLDEHIQVLKGRRKFGKEYRKIPNWPDFEEWELAEFNSDERSMFIRKYLNHMNKQHVESVLTNLEIDERVTKVSFLASAEPDIFSKPVHAKILTELGAEPTFDLEKFEARISRWDLYEAFFNYLAERETEKEARRDISEDGRIDFLREIAFWLWSKKDGATSFSLHEIPDQIVEKIDEGGTYNFDTKIREYLSSAFLERKSGDIFFFGHRSFAEFLVADRMLRNNPDGKEHDAYGRLLRTSVLDFFLEGLGETQLCLWASTLSSISGTLDINYVRLLSRTCGNFREMRGYLGKGDLVTELLSCFGDTLDYNPVFETRLLRNIRKASNVESFFLTLKLLHLSMSNRRLRKEGVDKDNLNKLALCLISNQTYTKGTFVNDTFKKSILVNGKKLRKVVGEALDKQSLNIIDSNCKSEFSGWPDEFIFHYKERKSMVSRLLR